MTTAIARRRENLKRLVHNYGLLTNELADNDSDLTRLVRASNAVLEAFASEDDNLSAAVSKLPGALGETRTALVKADRARPASSARRSSRCGRRSASSTRPTRRCCRWRARARRSCATSCGPFARIATPYFEDLGVAARDLGKAGARPHHQLREAQPPVQHRRLQPRRRRGHQRRLRERAAPARPPSATASEGYLYWLGLDGAEHRVAVQHRATPTGRSAASSCGGATCATLHEHGPAGRPRVPVVASSGALHAMIKQAPSIGRIVAMVVFTLSCFGLLLFLWLAFGGSVPLKPEGYRFKVAFPEAATLAVEADVRMAGVNVGKVKTKELDKGAARTHRRDRAQAAVRADPQGLARDPAPEDAARRDLRRDLDRATSGPATSRTASTLPNAQVEDTVQLDEIFNAFDEETRDAFKEWVAELTEGDRGPARRGPQRRLRQPRGLRGRRRQAAQDARRAGDRAAPRWSRTRAWCSARSTSARAQLRELIVNSNNTFEATASRDEALAETFAIFPTFLDESKATLARLEDFARDTHPLVNDLKGPADDLGPTAARPRRPGPRPRGAVPRPRPADQGLRGRPARARADGRPARAVLRERPPVLPRAQPDPVVPELPPGDGRRLPLERRARPLARSSAAGAARCRSA